MGKPRVSRNLFPDAPAPCFDMVKGEERKMAESNLTRCPGRLNMVKNAEDIQNPGFRDV